MSVLKMFYHQRRTHERRIRIRFIYGNHDWWNTCAKRNSLWIYRVTRFLICEHKGQRPDREAKVYHITDIEEAASYGLSYLVWWFVAYGELLGGLGLIVGGLMNKPYLPILKRCYIPDIGDAITRFSGITLCCIMTGVIWRGEPESFMDVLLYDNLHVLLWVGALFFALRGNNAK